MKNSSTTPTITHAERVEACRQAFLAEVFGRHQTRSELTNQARAAAGMPKLRLVRS